MSILFETYTLDPASGAARLPFSTAGRDTAGTFGAAHLPFGTLGEDGITLSPPAQGHATLVLRTFGADTDGALGHAVLPFGASGSSTAIAAPDLAIGTAAILFDTRGHGFTISAPAQGDVTLPFDTFGADVAAFGHASLPLGTRGREDGVLRTATLYQFPWIEANGFTGITLALADGFSLRETLTPDAVQALMDLMVFYDGYSRLINALAEVTATMTLRDTAQMLWDAGLLDTFIASGVPLGLSQLTLLLSDSFVATEQADALTTILAALADSFYATMTLTVGDEVYTAWVMTPQTKAMRSYSNFPFNSFAQRDGVVFAAGPQGVYRLGGKTDTGTVISARIRSGLNDLGSRLLKRIDRAYIGYTSNGELRLRVTATTQDGAKTVYTYRMVNKPADAPRQSRVQIGRGPRSVYWAFEVCNDEAGSEFALDNMTILPMVLTGKVT
jgi:hypothetical protein